MTKVRIKPEWPEWRDHDTALAFQDRIFELVNIEGDREHPVANCKRTEGDHTYSLAVPVEFLEEVPEPRLPGNAPTQEQIDKLRGQLEDLTGRFNAVMGLLDPGAFGF